MTIVYSIIAIIVVLASFFLLSVKLNRRSCLKAYAQGVDDLGSLPWRQIKERYRSFLYPIRPMDAAAYKRGIEYALLSSEGDNSETMKDDFSQAWDSNAINSEGTNIRAMGAEKALESFEPSVPEKLKDAVLANPDEPPLASKIRIEDSGA